MTLSRELEKEVLEKCNVGEVYYLYKEAYKRAYGKYPVIKIVGEA